MFIGDMSAGEATVTPQQRTAWPTMTSEAGSPGSSDSGSDGAVFEPDFDLSPLIKEELRSTIRNRRINSGKSDDLSYDDTPKPEYKLTKEEEEKRQLRRDRNRVAAAKCRMKRKQETIGLSLESEKLETRNARLREEIEKLKHEKQTLLQLINSHRPSCIMRATSGPDVAQTVHMPHSVR